MIIQHAFLCFWWLVFCTLHSVFAGEEWKYKMKALLKSGYKFYRIIYSFFALITLAIAVIYNFSIPSFLLWKIPFIEKAISTAGIITGLLLMLLFTKRFFFDLSGADVFQKKQTARTLIRTDFYKHVRHPLYSATLLFIWSIFLSKPLLSNLITCICITAYTLIGIYIEEKKLIKEFGNNYITYRSATPMLIPELFK